MSSVRSSDEALIAAKVTRFGVVPVRRVSDRLAMTRMSYRMPDGSEVTALSVSRLDPALERFEVVVVFDVDDIEAACAELDHLAAQAATPP